VALLAHLHAKNQILRCALYTVSVVVSVKMDQYEQLTVTVYLRNNVHQ